jgi:hypothetical protein
VVPGLVGDHDAVVEGVELEVAILPPLLLPSDVLREETPEFCDGRGLGRREGRGMGRAAHRSRHRAGIRMERVVGVVGDMRAGMCVG